MKKRIIAVVLCVFLLVGVLCSCKGSKTASKQLPFDTKAEAFELSNNETIADNDAYSLKYDADKASIKLLENGGSRVWTATPTSTGSSSSDDWGFSFVVESDFVNSAIRVGYIDKKINGGGDGKAYSYVNSRENGRIVCKDITDKNGTRVGITVEYYFDNEEFMVPVDFILHDDYLDISIDTTRIQENDKYPIAYIDLAPFFCAVENKSEETEETDETDEESTEEVADGETAEETVEEATDETVDEETSDEATEETTEETTEEQPEESYLFMPSGSGALIQTDAYDITGLDFESYIYGDDITQEDYYKVSDTAAIRMPVYGYKDGDQGGFFIIDDGAETAILKSTSGSTSENFSSIYPSFQVRSFTEHQARNFNNTYVAKIFPDDMIESKLSVRFYPLKDDKANYSAMADIYRDYLIEECGLKKTGEDKSMNLTLIGGAEITKSLLGIPYTTVLATTTVEDANNIVSDITKDVKNLSVKLKGFGNSGVDLGTIGGGFDVNSNIGSKKQLKKLSTLCTDSNVDLYMDYDIVQFNAGGSGFSYTKDVVMNCGLIRADQFIFDKAVRTIKKDMKYRLLRPVEFDKAVSKTIKSASKFNIAGISLDTLSTLTYSDYSNNGETTQYNSKVGFDAAVTNALSQIKDQKFMASDANIFAALSADIITDVPTTSAEGYAFVESVPFYAMVFKGYIPMTSQSINLDATPEKIILGAVEGGIGLNYTVINTWDNALIDSVNDYFYSSQYSSIKDDVVDTYKQLEGYYNSIKGATIVSNEVIASGVHCTVFDNGVKAYVNYNNNSVETEIGVIDALGFEWEEGA